MEVKTFTESLFVPLMIQKETFGYPDLIAMNMEGILNSTNWVEDDVSGICFIPDIVKIEIAFDTNINDIANFDPSKADVFSIVATKPKFLYVEGEMTDDQNTNMLKNIMNCFDGDMILLPEELRILSSLFECNWSYRISLDHCIYPCVSEGRFGFECL